MGSELFSDYSDIYESMTVPSPVCKLCGETDVSQFRQRTISGKMYYVKYCRACEAKLSREYHAAHKEERAQYQKKYIAENKDIVREKKKEYDKNHYPLIKEDKALYDKEYAKNNRDVINNNRKNRRKNDPTYKLSHYISGRIRKILGKFGHKKKGSCINHLDYSFQELKEHIEQQFESWMNWDNQGVYDPETWDDNDPSTWKWQLDHIIPVSTFNYTSMEDEEFKKCWALTNLRPLSAKQNHLDGVKRIRHGK